MTFLRHPDLWGLWDIVLRRLSDMPVDWVVLDYNLKGPCQIV